MIQVDAETAAALRNDSVEVKPRVLWIHGDGDSIDISDRLMTFPSTSMSLGAFLSGATSSRAPLSLQNADRVLTIDNSGGLFGNRQPKDRSLAKIAIDAGIKRADGTYEYVPIHTGYSDGPVYQPGSVDFDLESPFMMLKDAEVPEDIVIDPSTATASDVAQGLIQDNTLMSAGDFDVSWSIMDTFYREIDWIVGGRIRKGTAISGAAESLARSGLATIVPHENGKLRLLSEFPEFRTFPNDQYGDVIDSTIGDNWFVSQSRQISATSVEVAYNSVSARYPHEADSTEDLVGKLHRTVACPYIYLGRCAATAAYILYEQHNGFPVTVSWTMGIRGIQIQLGDRVRVLDPVTETERTVRIVSKGWSNTRLQFAGVEDGHESSVIRRTYARWDSTTWGSGTEYLL
jgi:hypothetical protein